ncbi:ACP S-malonyltransferase [Maridesulfovibrio hydrothermalis]|uniref:Malonyl CoA-acyl carrier protein transacylase n=1 Tax=Maridesulfovibrio hydrothermalis AM13 = DSM 14728 TaxID=1121451 RepID=L0RAE3_9BACT|nr:ACP S-malonyltransferase [Maridesulfovibrio hydrothermalis]CCO23160.1 Acyl transferase [Maridesulfovibrio hydrothermalis AM13 = DSM 14728]
MSDLSILFPGQGSQEPAMGRDLAEKWSEAMDMWKFAESESGIALREIYWEGNAADMAKTDALQPALTVVNLSLWQYLKDSLKPAATAGHSLGEFASLGASGVLSVEDTIKAVSLRGKLMSQVANADHGMAAVLKLAQSDVEEAVEFGASETGKQLRIANYNSPAQYVISGEKAALDAAGTVIKEKKGRAIALPVSGAFHSPLIQEAADEFASYLKKLHWNSPAFPVYFNATASTESNPEEIKKIMCSQMTSSVRWIEIIASQYAAGMHSFFELGPKGVLTKLLAANLKGQDYEGKGIGSLEQADALK